jgi:hypothetical protein
VPGRSASTGAGASAQRQQAPSLPVAVAIDDDLIGEVADDVFDGVLAQMGVGDNVDPEDPEWYAGILSGVRVGASPDALEDEDDADDEEVGPGASHPFCDVCDTAGRGRPMEGKSRGSTDIGTILPG